MSIFSRRKTAWLLLAAVAVVFTVIGINRSVASQAKKVESSFYTGVYDTAAGYRRPAVDAQLTSRINAALGLVTCCSGVEEVAGEADALRAAREALLNAATIEQKYEANRQLESAWLVLASAMQEHGMDLSDDAVADYISTLSGAEAMIEQSGYNAGVSAFYETVMGTLPVRMLRFLIFVDMPVYFGTEE